MLQMEDLENKHGYLPVYSGKETAYVCQNLRKNTTYKFRVIFFCIYLNIEIIVSNKYLYIGGKRHYVTIIQIR